MKTIMTVVLAMAATAGLSLAADHPNFSGDWTMDAAKSDPGPIPAPASMTRKVAQGDPAITVVEAQVGGPQGDVNSTSKYSADGTETANTMMGAVPTKSTAKWDGSNLLIVTKADFQGMEITINSKWSLSADGKVWTDAWHLVTPQGEIDITWVLNKK
jgi:hypothetical protein